METEADDRAGHRAHAALARSESLGLRGATLSGAKTARTRPLLRSPAWWALVAIFALEFFLFDRFGSRRETPFYPRWNDQIQYLTESYAGYEYAKTHGLASGLWQALTNQSAQGTLHDFSAILAFTLAGPSRSAALALNLLALVAWQAVLFFSISRLSGSRALAFAAALLPLALAGPWQSVPGSAYDFRLDHFTMCGLGICAALAAATEGFRSTRFSIAFGVAVGVTLLTRFLTGAYFVLIFGALLGWVLTGTERKQRALNLGCAALLAFVLAAPIFWLNRDTVRDYYWFGHYVGPESAIRNPHMGLGRSLAFVWGQLFQRHVGWFFGGVAVTGAIGFILLRGGTIAARISALLVAGAIFLLAPALVLTLHQQKSEVVVSALAPGLVLLVVAAWSWTARRATERALGTGATALALATLVFFAQRQMAPVHSPAVQHDLRLVNSIADEIFRRIRAGNLREARVAADYITDALDAQVLRVIWYERHRVLLPINMTLPTGIAEPNEATIFDRLRESDFVFLTEDAPPGPYPYDRKLAALRPQVRAWCDANLRVANQFTLFGRRMLLYQRREIPFP